MRTISLTTLALASLLAGCATDPTTDAQDAVSTDDDDVQSTDDVQSGCPGLPDVSTLNGVATLYTNGITIDLAFGGEDWTSMLNLFFQHDDTHTFAPGTFALTDAPSSNVCALAPGDARCPASSLYAVNSHLMLLGGRNGEIEIDVANIADVGRVSGTVTVLDLEELDEDGMEYVAGGCQLQLGPIAFDVDLSLPTPGMH